MSNPPLEFCKAISEKYNVTVIIKFSEQEICNDEMLIYDNGVIEKGYEEESEKNKSYLLMLNKLRKFNEETEEFWNEKNLMMLLD